MLLKPKRPVYLNVMQIRQPLPAIVSILHRASGVVLFLLLPLLLCLFSSSLASDTQFAKMQLALAHPVCRFFFGVVLSALVYHLIAGIRHLLMDMGIGETLLGGRLSAKIVLCISIVAIVLLGVWLW